MPADDPIADNRIVAHMLSCMDCIAILYRDGVVRDLEENDSSGLNETDFVWEHVELSGEDALPATVRGINIPSVVRSALVASETRPRCDAIEDGAILNLRGSPSTAETEGDRLVSIRAWVHGNTVISVSRKNLAATSTVVAAMRAGKIVDSGDLAAAFAQAISGDLDPEVASLGDKVDDCESELETRNIYQLRRRITAIRAEAIAYRRFIAPNRDALFTLAGLNVKWLADDDRLNIREAADRFARMAEELEAVRERAALMHEQLTDLRAELIDQRSLMIAVVAFIFLPLTFITGLLGMNVSGIPFAHRPWAFWGVVAFCCVVGVAVLGWFEFRRWLSK